ncbi:MAG: family 43 glycosylhydrolase, partial [Bacteroidota bacterium]
MKEVFGQSKLIVIALFISAMFSCEKEPVNNQPDPEPVDTIVAAGHYRNPLTVEHEDLMADKTEGIADPSVFRWMGKYYLMSTQYYSNHGGEEGFKVWESIDLVEWKYIGATQVQNFIWEVLWSPELYYYRGDFYIYLSGPYGEMAVWKYEVPADVVNPNPFGVEAHWVAVTHNYLQVADHAIDGSLLIEPNGDKYMFFSGLNGVKYRKVNSMTDGNGEDVIQLGQCTVDNIVIGGGTVGTVGWTEAPTCFKHNNKYYMTYTGNHYLRPDYQVHLAVGNSLQDIVPIADNPFIFHNSGEWTGTGNCYPVVGPNLKDYYYTYHTKKGYRISAEDDVYRKLMLDKVEFTATGINSEAPTFDDRLIPELAEYRNDFSNGTEGLKIIGNVEKGSFALNVDATATKRS